MAKAGNDMHGVQPTDTAVHLRLSQHPRALAADGAEVTLSLVDGALLSLLAIDGPQSRLRVAALLWPACDDATARNRLRQRLFKLRRTCSGDVIEGHTTLALADGVSHDLADAPTLLGEMRLDQHPELDQWLQAERQRRFVHRREALAQEIDALEAAGDLDAAATAAQTLLGIDPLSEDAHRRLMRLHYLRGDRTAALLAFDRCAELLKDEVGARPSAQTMQLLQSVQQDTVQAALQPQRQVPASVMRPPRMVGRDALRQAIVQDVRGGAVAVIVGEAGMGKSRMLAELGADLGRRVGATARPGDAGVPFSSLARLLRELVRECPACAGAVQRREMARLLPEFGPAPAEATPHEGTQLEQALRAAVAAAHGEVQTLVFDDLHFADAASLDMLQALTAASQPRWVLALRPAEAGSATKALLDALADAGRLAMTALEPLSERDLAELIDLLDLPGLEGSALAAPLLQQCGGNPLFALETIKLVLQTDDTAAGARLAALPRPASVLALIERRLARLSPAALAVARVAAVCGSDFGAGIAEFVLDQPALLLADAWKELARAQVLRDSQFAHDLVFEAVQRDIPPPIARHTHARVAAYLVDHGGEPARIAAHWLQADLTREALPWLKAAAAAAGQALRSKEQFDFLLQAVTIEEQMGLRSDSFATLLKALTLDGKTGRRVDLALDERLQALARTPREQAQAGAARMEQYSNLTRYDEAVQCGRAALALAETCDDLALRNDIQQVLGAVLAMAGRPAEAAELLLPLREWIEENAPPLLRGDYFGNLGIVLDNLGRIEEALPFHERAMEISRELGRWSELAIVFCNLAVNRLDKGEIDAATAHLREAERVYMVYESHEVPPTYTAITLTLCCRMKGRFEEARHWAELAQQRATARDSATLNAQMQYALAGVWIDLGQFARAEQLVDQVLQTDDLSYNTHAGILVFKARSQRWRGEPAQATLDRALALLPEGARVDLRHAILLEQTFHAAPLQALALTETVMDEARAVGHEARVLAAWARRAGALAPHDPALALAAAQRALEGLATLQSAAVYRPETWLDIARALRAANEPARAQAVLAGARDWILAAVESAQVGAPFVDAFLHRNPVNREILALCGKDRPPRQP